MPVPETRCPNPSKRSARMTDGGSGQNRTVVIRLKRTVLSRLSYAPETGAGTENRTQLCWFVGPVSTTSGAPRHNCKGGAARGRFRISVLAPGARVERACPAFQTGALTATASLANLMENEGIDATLAWSGCGESNSVDRTGDPAPNQKATPAELIRYSIVKDQAGQIGALPPSRFPQKGS